MQVMMRALLALVALVLVSLAAIDPVYSQSTEQSAPVAKIDKRKLLVQPRNADGSVQETSIFEDPVLWARDKQQNFYRQMSGALRQMTGGSGLAAAWTLMLLSFGYGIFHAAGPGHGKAVISAWLLATESELRRGVLISFMSAIIQALTAIVLMSVLFLVVASVGSTARNVAGVLESASYGMIALLGAYLIWTAAKVAIRITPAQFSLPLVGRDQGWGAASRDLGHTHPHPYSYPSPQGGGEYSRTSPVPYNFDSFTPLWSEASGHIHGPDCGCGHAHVPAARDLRGGWSLAKAFSLAFAVGIRPCTGAILVLVFANGLGLYWAGVASTFAMALGTFITVSLIAGLAVYSKKLATRLAGRSGRWLDWLGLGLRFGGGLAIAFLGAILFLGSLGSTNVMM